MRAWVIKKGKKYLSSDGQDYGRLSKAQLFPKRADTWALTKGEEVKKVKVTIEEE